MAYPFIGLPFYLSTTLAPSRLACHAVPLPMLPACRPAPSSTKFVSVSVSAAVSVLVSVLVCRVSVSVSVSVCLRVCSTDVAWESAIAGGAQDQVA